MYSRNTRFTRVRIMAVLTAVVLAGLACGDNSTEPQPTNNPLPDFTLQDLNQESDSFMSNLSLRSYEGRVLVMYFLRGGCGICRNQWAGMAATLDSLRAQGTSNVFGFAINVPQDTAALPSIRDMHINMPVLQDTMMSSGGIQVAAVGSLLGASGDWHDLLILDGEQIIRRKSSAYLNDDIDLSTEEGRTTLKAWIQQVITAYM